MGTGPRLPRGVPRPKGDPKPPPGVVCGGSCSKQRSGGRGGSVDAVPAPHQADGGPNQAPEQKDVHKDGEAAGAEASNKQDMEPASKRQRVPETEEDQQNETQGPADAD